MNIMEKMKPILGSRTKSVVLFINLNCFKNLTKLRAISTRSGSGSSVNGRAATYMQLLSEAMTDSGLRESAERIE